MAGLLDALAAISVDGWTVAIGILIAVMIVPIRYLRGHRAVFSKSRFAVDLLNGVTIVPFVLMIGAVFSKAVQDELLRSNLVLIAVAGTIGIVFAICEILKPLEAKETRLPRRSRSTAGRRHVP